VGGVQKELTRSPTKISSLENKGKDLTRKKREKKNPLKAESALQAALGPSSQTGGRGKRENVRNPNLSDVLETRTGREKVVRYGISIQGGGKQGELIRSVIHPSID